MSFYQQLLENTRPAQQQHLLSAPIIARCFTGHITRDDYVAFLLQAYHHVKHTVPLLMGVGAKQSLNISKRKLAIRNGY
jgi:thiaminase